jgi:tRNA(Ile)-lysidine synthase
MIHFQGKIADRVAVAYSGGVDSVAVLDFVMQRPRTVVLVHVNHGNEIASAEQAQAEQAAERYSLPLYLCRARSQKNREHSWEEHWRLERYKFFHQIELPVITGHQLDDCVETWLWNMCNGRDQTIAYRNVNVIRPFRLNRKHEFVDWCERKQIPWFEDPTNADPTFACRNHIRHRLLPEVERVNPGIFTTIRNRLLAEKI